jgi:hypothetical protein
MPTSNSNPNNLPQNNTPFSSGGGIAPAWWQWLITLGQFNSGTFNAQLNGFATPLTLSFAWMAIGQNNGKLVDLTCITGGFAVSTVPDMSLSGLPAAISPATTKNCMCPFSTVVNDGSVAGVNSDCSVNSAGNTITFRINGGSSGWTVGQNMGVLAGWHITYGTN